MMTWNLYLIIMEALPLIFSYVMYNLIEYVTWKYLKENLQVFMKKIIFKPKIHLKKFFVFCVKNMFMMWCGTNLNWWAILSSHLNNIVLLILPLDLQRSIDFIFQVVGWNEMFTEYSIPNYFQSNNSKDLQLTLKAHSGRTSEESWCFCPCQQRQTNYWISFETRK